MIHRSVVVCAVLALPSVAAAFETNHTLNPRPAGLDAADFNLWIPDTLPANRPIRGVLGSSNYHAGNDVYTTAEWRAIATQHDFAILRYYVTSGGDPIDTSRTGLSAIFQAMKELAPRVGRPELEFAGLIPTGLSWGAHQVCRFASYQPERIICALPFRATGNDIGIPGGSAAGRAVPLLHMSAGKESFNGYKPSQSQSGHLGLPAQGARFAMLVGPDEPHHVLGNLSYVKLWLEEIVALRIPAAIPAGAFPSFLPLSGPGWSGSFDIQVLAQAPWNGGEGMVNVSIAAVPAGGSAPTSAKSWFPSERLAQAWLNYAQTGSVGTVGPAPTPTPTPMPTPTLPPGTGSGGILREWWSGVAGTAVSDIPTATAPSGSETIPSFEGPSGFGDNYGTRIRGTLHAPSSGAYTFWIAGDDNAELWLSTGPDPAQKVRIAWVPDWTNSREWTKYAEQKSAAVTLAADGVYYVEVLHKEGAGGDNVAVAWALGAGSPTLIAGEYVSPAAPAGGGSPAPSPSPTPTPSPSPTPAPAPAPAPSPDGVDAPNGDSFCGAQAAGSSGLGAAFALLALLLRRRTSR